MTAASAIYYDLKIPLQFLKQEQTNRYSPKSILVRSKGMAYCLYITVYSACSLSQGLRR